MDQGDLFAQVERSAVVPTSPIGSSAMPAPKELDDASLAAAIAYASLATCAALAAEVVARRLVAAVPSLEDLCRRFKGFARTHPVREQGIALETLAALGGPQAAAALTRLIGDRVVERPGLPAALSAAVILKARLPASIVLEALDDADPALRALACRCARSCPQSIPRLIELLEDLHSEVSNAAAVSLGRMGRHEAKPALLRMIRSVPVAETIDALSSIADEDCLVELGRLADAHPNLRDVVCDALDGLDHPRAIIVLSRLKRGRFKGQI